MADMSDDEAGLAPMDWPIQDAPSPADSVKSDLDIEDRHGGGPLQPIQKRRRVTRACDECRRKKIKCDGKQPCTHCSVYSYECTYDKPSNRRRNPAPQYIEALEGRLHRAEALLRKYMPEVDLTDANLDPTVQQEFQNREKARAQAASKVQAGPPTQPDASDIKLMSMIDSVGQLDLDDRGDWDFYGRSSGTIFFKKMKENFRGLLDPINKGPFLPRSERTADDNLNETSNSFTDSMLSVTPDYPELPRKDTARRLCYYSLSCATCLVRIVHVPSFYERLDRLYEMPLDNLTREDTHFLALVYSVLALGCMYNNLDDSAESVGYQAVVEEGNKYHKAARKILGELADCRDIVSIQALLFLILFLQSTSNLSSCYAYVGIAMRSALRIGLHRNLRHERIGNVENETRKRVFYVIRQMDIYVSTLLGFPLLLHADDIDQPFPLEVDDEFITNQGIIQPPPGTFSFFAAFNAHTRLMETLHKITKSIYPTQSAGSSGHSRNATCMISYSRIKDIESELHTWFQRLPEAWRPSPDGPTEIVRVRHLLRFAYAHVQLVLYRPFLHYISPRLTQGSKVDELTYACAAAAISVSRNIVHIGLEIRKQRVLSGPYWFMLYTEFFAVISLVFYVVENPGKPGCADVLADAKAGRQMIADLADKTVAAETITSALTALFDQLPDMLEQGRARLVAPSNRAGSGFQHHVTTSQRPNMSHVMSPTHSEDFTRSRSGHLAAGAFGTPNSISSADGIAPSEHSYNDHGYPVTTSMHDIYPMDLSSRATSEATSTIGNTNHPSFLSQTLSPQSMQNPVHKLDSLMFPSDDPFAYPNQPMMELGYQNKSDASAALAQDTNFFFQGSMDDLNEQFLGQPPPYMMQQNQSHGGMPMTANMYDPNDLLGLQGSHTQQQPARPQQVRPPVSQQEPPQAQQAQNRQQRRLGLSFFNRRVRAERQQERQIEQIFTEHGMQADFGSFFGSGRGGFQGM